MAKYIRTSLVVALVAIASTFVFAGPASAKTNYIAHRCGGMATTKTALMAHWRTWGINDDMAQTYGLSSVDVALKTYVNQTFGTFTLAQDATIHDNGCNPGRVTPVGDKTLKKGTLIFGDQSRLNAKYGRGGWSSTFRHGWLRKKVQIRSRAMTTCTNPISGSVTVWVWIAPAAPKANAKPKKAAPKKAPSCTNTSGTSVGDCNQQSNTAKVDQTATVTPTCKGNSTDSANCNTVIIQNTTIVQINAVCSKVIVTMSDGSTNTVFKDSNGNVVTENYCSSAPTTTTPSCTSNCTLSPTATVTNLTPLQDQGGVLAGNTYKVCALFTTSEEMSVNFTAHYGSFSNASATVVNGTLTVCADYTAPNDVQAAADDYHAVVTYKGKIIAHADLAITVQPQPPARP